MDKLGFRIKRPRSRRYKQEFISDLDFSDGIALWGHTIQRFFSKTGKWSNKNIYLCPSIASNILI